MKKRRPADFVGPQTVAWVVAGLALVVLPHLPRLPAWMAILVLMIWAWRLALVIKPVALPSKWVLALLALGASAGVVASYGTLLGRDAGVALLNLMLALKLLELRDLRDAYSAVLLGFFVAITHFLYSQSIPMAIYILFVLLALTVVLMALENPPAGKGALAELRPRWALAARLLAQATPLALVLFVLFPRVPGPLWSLPVDAYQGLTGLDDQMSPGRISQLSRSDAVAFRVQFDGEPPGAELRYWRGPVFWYTDGATWSRGLRARTGRRSDKVPDYRGLGEAVNYTVTLEPHNRRWLFALDLPVAIPEGAELTGDFQLLASAKIRQRIRYTLSSHPRYRMDRLGSGEGHRGLQLPRRVSPRVESLVVDWKGSALKPETIVAKALAYFREEPFVYTLSPPLLEADPVDEFLFETRRGFCEHYSAAFTLLMRVAGIPARVVTGYQGGELNPLGDYLIVRQSDAHAWSEVWLKDRGWVRVDPTAAVAPERVERGIDTTVLGEGRPVRFQLASGGWLSPLLKGWSQSCDAVDNLWNQWVLSYGPKRQMQLLTRFGFEKMDWWGLGVLLSAGMTLTLLIVAGLVLGKGARERDAAKAAYERFCQKLGTKGLGRDPTEGPLDYSGRICAKRPDLAASVRCITAMYITLRYGRGEARSALGAKAELGRLSRLVRAFRP